MKWARHHWRTRTVLMLDYNQVVPCNCAWYTRLWYLLTFR